MNVRPGRGWCLIARLVERIDHIIKVTTQSLCRAHSAATEGFDTTTTLYLAAPMLMQNVPVPTDPHMAVLMTPLDQYDPHSVFDNEAFP